MVLSIDIGTTTCKAALFDASGAMLEILKVPLSINSNANGAHEADPCSWEVALGDICAGFRSLKDIQAVVVSGNGPTVVPVYSEPEGQGKVVHACTGTARLWLDRRSVAEAVEVSRLTGAFVDSSFVLPQILHMKHHEPGVYAKSRWFLSSSEFFVYLLTAQARSVLHAEDALRWYWTADMLDKLGLDADKFPPFCRPGELVGTVSSVASRALGLPRGTPVFSAGPDFLVSILGCAVVSPGMVCDRSGTSEGVNLCTEQPLGDDRLMTYLHPVKPFHNVSGIISTSGKAIDWARSLVGLHDDGYEQMYRMMRNAKPGSGGMVFLPYLSGERAPLWDPDARAVFSGLTLATGREALLRSVAEGVCLAIRDVIEVMDSLGGTVRELRVTGGPSESDFLNQLKADVTSRAVEVPKNSDAELVGSMILAMTSLGAYADLAEAANDLVVIDKRFEPDHSLAPMYDELFDQYRATYRNLRDTWRKH